MKYAWLGGVYPRKERMATILDSHLASEATCVIRDRQFHPERLVSLYDVRELVMSHGKTYRLLVASKAISPEAATAAKDYPSSRVHPSCYNGECCSGEFPR